MRLLTEGKCVATDPFVYRIFEPKVQLAEAVTGGVRPAKRERGILRNLTRNVRQDRSGRGTRGELEIRMRRMTWMALALPLLAAAPAAAQQQPFNPTINFPAAGCTATAAELEAAKKTALEFFAPNVDRVALADPTYKQHNPAFVKGAREAGMNDYDYFKSRFGGPPAARGGGAGARAGGAPAGPQPPQAAPYEFAVAQCDTVFILRKQYRQDPTLAPGNFYEAYSFDAFRVRNGKLVEHWDMAVINPPAAAPAGGRGQ
jgi:predicted SnoaL-like aldol condensation-catalyzing enzyme